MHARSYRLVVTLLTVLGLSGPAARADETPLTIAAASDLKFALEEVAAAYTRDSGHDVRTVYGSSGHFHAQILQGAPFDLFLSADEELIFRLADAGKTRDRGKLYAVGRLVLFVPHGANIEPDDSLTDFRAAATDGRLRKLAIANPLHAPYGMRAREALQHMGLWDAVSAHLVLGENIAQAAQFALTGAVDASLIALSLVHAPGFADRGRFVLIPADWHQPLRQRMVVLDRAQPTAQAFYAYLGTPAARAILHRHGFTLPES